MSYFNCNIYKSKNWNKDLNTKKQTNADKIRNMTDEELAEFLEKVESGHREEIGIKCKDKCNSWNCAECIRVWLQSEVEE